MEKEGFFKYSWVQLKRCKKHQFQDFTLYTVYSCICEYFVIYASKCIFEYIVLCSFFYILGNMYIKYIIMLRTFSRITVFFRISYLSNKLSWQFICRKNLIIGIWFVDFKEAFHFSEIIPHDVLSLSNLDPGGKLTQIFE